MLLLLLASPFLAWWLIWRVRRSIQKPWLKNSLTSLIIVIVIAYPAADDLIGKYQFDKLCEKEAVVKIYRKVEGVEGFQYDGSSAEWVKRNGYKFVEGKPFGRCPTRYFLDRDGTVKEEEITTPQSKYQYRLLQTELPIYTIKQQRVIEDIESGEMLAARTSLYYRGGWLQRTVSPIGGGTGYGCPKDTVSSTDFVQSVLVPSKSN